MPKGKRKERKVPKAGTKFSKKFKDKEYTLTVVEDDGEIKYEVREILFNSPSTAAQSVVENKYNINGWIFWG
jgi:hypothetical protein